MRRLALVAFSLVTGCGPRHYRLISHDENYSQDPSLVIRVSQVVETAPGRTSVEVAVENHRTEPVPLAELKTVLLDPRSEEAPLVSRPEGTLAPGERRAIAIVFDTSRSPRGQFSMRLVLPVAPSQVGPNRHETRIWPIVFRTGS
jgi:hypothetical protein